LKKKEAINAKTDTVMVEITYDCRSCPYKKHEGCYGYCIKRVLNECKVIWEKNKKRGQKNE